MIKADVPKRLQKTIFNANVRGEGYTIPESANSIWTKTAEALVQKGTIVKRNNGYFLTNQEPVKKHLEIRSQKNAKPAKKAGKKVVAKKTGKKSVTKKTSPAKPAAAPAPVSAPAEQTPPAATQPEASAPQA